MLQKRTDLALEAREIWQESAEKTTALPGVRARRHRREGFPVTAVDILNEEGAAALGKPRGRYVTLELKGRPSLREEFFPRAVRALGEELREILPEEGSVLVLGLGSRAMTPDAVGPLAVEHLLITRHLLAEKPALFSPLRSVAAWAPGVLAATGVESAEAAAGLVERLRPAAVIAVDALASRRMERLCSTVQLSDSGIVPGSGVGNHRAPLSRETLGVPVIAVGAPTVVDGATLAADLLEEAGVRDIPEETLRRGGGSAFVTPRDIDARVRELGRIIGCGINLALHGLSLEEQSALLS